MKEKIILSQFRKEKIEEQALELVKSQFLSFPEQWDMVKDVQVCHKEQLFPKGSIVYYQYTGISVAFFAFSCENIEKESQLDSFYVHMWQSAYLNAIRSQIALIIREEKEEVPAYESELRGPGYGQIGLDQLSYYADQADASSIGITIQAHHLCPEQSCVGSILFSDDKKTFETSKTGCADCKSAKENCFLCIYGQNKNRKC